MEKGFISKTESKYIYGIAIVLMVGHHFFGFPERMNVRVLPLGGSLESTIELYMGYFGRICISMYAFISGYGMYKKSCANQYSTILGTLCGDIKQSVWQGIHFLSITIFKNTC